MSEIIKKLRHGVASTGSKVKNIVDFSRFKVKIAQKEDQIEEEYREIGKLIYQSWKNKPEIVGSDAVVAEHCGKIAGINAEINEIQARINEAKKIRQCSCGEVVSLDTKFCPECGTKFLGT